MLKQEEFYIGNRAVILKKGKYGFPRRPSFWSLAFYAFDSNFKKMV